MAKYKNSFMLFMAAVIWGVAFVAQSVGMEYVGPLTFNGVRSLIAAVVLFPCVLLFDKLEKGKDPKKKWNKKVIIGGIVCGLVFFVASNLQQFGIQYTTVGKAGFITAFYIVIVPIMGIFIRRKCPWTVWISIVLAIIGLYLLCITEKFTIGLGDILVFLCAFMFAVHILVIDHYSPMFDGVRLSCIQFLVCGVLSSIAMFIFEEPKMDMITTAWLPILYAGVFSSGVAYTFQILGQKNMNPAVASLILSLESVVSVIAGWMILGQKMSTRELIGCGIMFIAVIIVECVPTKKKESAKELK